MLPPLVFNLVKVSASCTISEHSTDFSFYKEQEQKYYSSKYDFMELTQAFICYPHVPM